MTRVKGSNNNMLELHLRFIKMLTCETLFHESRWIEYRNVAACPAGFVEVSILK